MAASTQRSRVYFESLEGRRLLSTYYVDPAGSDEGGGSLSLPWQTLQKAAGSVFPGDSVVVRPGSYAGFNLNSGGDASGRVTFTAEAGAVIDRPVVIGSVNYGINASGKSYVTIEGFTFIPQPDQGEWYTAIRVGGAPGEWAVGNVIRNNTARMRVVGRDATPDKYGIYSSWQDGILVDANSVSGGWNSGIYTANGCRNYSVRGNEVYDVGGNGIHNNGDLTAGPPGINSNAVIEGNVIHNVGFGIGGQAISCDGVQDSHIRNNLLYDVHAKGISLYVVDAADGSARNVVANNTVLVAADGQVPLRLNHASSHNTVINNIFLTAAPGGAWTDCEETGLVETTIDHNVTTGVEMIGSVERDDWGTTYGFDAHSIIANDAGTLFVDAGTHDYRLAVSSPAIDAGTNFPAPRGAPLFDLAGNRRPHGRNWDVGAYEFQLAPDNQPPVITGIEVVDALSTRVTIAWRTDEPADAQVEYGRSTSDERQTPVDPDLLNSHGITLTELEPATVYRVRVRSRDTFGNLAISPEFFIETPEPDTMSPVISSLDVGEVSETAAVIRWETNEVSHSQVMLGVRGDPQTPGPVDASFVTAHQIVLTGLNPGTRYYVRATSRDRSGNVGVSETVSFATPPLPPTPTGQAARWSLDESGGNTAADSSANGLHGELLGGLVFAQGRRGNALNFDGVDDRIRVPRAPAIETSSISVSAWVNLPNGVVQAGWATVAKKTFADDAQAPNGSYSLHFSPNSQSNHVSFYVGYATGGMELISPAPVPTGRWVHLAATYDPANGERRLFVDGKLVAQDDLSEPIAYDRSPTGDLYLGQDPGPGEALLGALDDVAVWARALTPGEVLALALDLPPDSSCPIVGSAELAYDRAPHRFVFRFSEPVIGAGNPSAYTVLNRTTGQPLDSEHLSVAYDPLTFTSTLSVGASLRRILPDGDYTVTLDGSLVADVAGNALDGDGDGQGGDAFSLSTFFLLGDVNRDRVVNHLDFVELYRHFGQTAATSSDGDLNFDEKVSFADFQLMELAFGRTLNIQSPQPPVPELEVGIRSPSRRPMTKAKTVPARFARRRI